ncbi:MAG TPA: hypothetical protein DCM05_18155 [Elusimicrobia bacterium]|nr:hypothetical protein [Elusimicrobiota bacterium]
MSRYSPTGRCDDFVSLIAQAEESRACAAQPWKPPLLQASLFPLNLAGRAVEGAARLCPPGPFFAFFDRVLRSIAGAHGGLPFDEEGMRRAERTHAEVLKTVRTPPALLCLMSHPLVNEEETGLGVEMSRHALLALRRLRGPDSRPLLMVGVDLFALDTLGAAAEQFYAGFMGHYHLGLDRQAHLRGPLGRRLMAKTAWTSAAARIEKALREGGELAMALAGGVPVTSRILYAAREAVNRLCRERPGSRPLAQALSLLEREEPFRELLRSGTAAGGLRRSAWRLMELWLCETLTRPRAYALAERGELCEPACRAFLACARALGWPEEAARARLSVLQEEFVRETPWRARFFRFLAARVLSRGRPVFLLPLRHRTRPLRLEFLAPELLGARPSEEFVRKNFP